MKVIKKNYKLIIGILIGSIITGTSVYAATVIASSSISYDNTTSKLSSTNVKDALDELSTKTELKNRDNIVEGYTYNQTSGSSNYCITGEENTCVKTTCYKSTTSNSCKAGDIIKYKVNDTDIVTFHVMFDNGTTMTMQTQKNTINNTPWISATDYATYNTDGTSCGYISCNDEGPMTVLMALERATKSWTNVNDQTYTMGTTTFKTNLYTGCDAYNSCTAKTYTLDPRTAKARMIALQEAVSLGCTISDSSCPKWMNNYLYNSTSYGGTVSDNSTDLESTYNNYGYWTMNASSSNALNSYFVNYSGHVNISNYIYSNHRGARAVVVINK